MRNTKKNKAQSGFDNNIVKTKDCIDTEVDLALPPHNLN